MTGNAQQIPPPGRPIRIFYGWWVVLACFLISIFVGCTVFYGFTAFFDPLVKEFGWSYTEISFALSLRGLEMSLLSPLIGFLVDRYGARCLAVAGCVAIGLGFIVMSFAHSLTLFYASIILIALGGGGCAAVVFMKVVANWFHKKIGLAMGLLTSGFGAAGVAIPALVWLVDGYGWRTAVVVIGVLMWGIGIPLALLIRNSPEPYGLHPDGDRTGPPADLRPGKGEGAGPAGGISFREALSHRAFVNMTLTEGIRMMVVMGVVTHIMPYLELVHIPRATAGLIAGLVSLLSVAGRLGFGWLSDYFDKRHMMALSLGLMTLGVFALCWVRTGWVMALFLVLFPSGFGGVVAVRGAMLQEYFGREAFGRLIGLMMGFSAFGGMIGPTLAGYVFDTTGGYLPTWIGFGIASCFTVLLMLAVRPKKRAP